MPPLPPDPTWHTPAPPWQLRLLGATQARCGSRTVDRWPTRATLLLLARLALAPHRDHPREELIELLWPGVSIDVGRNRLRQALSSLKSLLGPEGGDIIDADRRALRLRPAVLECDACRFEQLARRGAWSEAAALYAGELLPGHYDEWVQEERTRLASLHDCATERRSGTAALGDLPARWTRVFGLEQRMAQVLHLLQSQRLVCLAGPGGAGKTRLAEELASTLATGTAGALPVFDQVALVPLASCNSEAAVLAMLAQRLHLGGRDPWHDLLLRLSGRRTMLVLDNLEQLLPQATGLVSRLLADAGPGLHLLLTSRVPTGLPGEQVVPVHGLPVPPAAPAADLARHPGVALLLDRAGAARPGLVADDETVQAAAQLVRLLDGLPLALELAASRCASLGLPGLLRRVSAAEDDWALQWLARPGHAGDADAGDRHGSIEAVIAWSWRLLSPAAKATLAAVAAFAGDASPDGVAAVLGEPPTAVVPALDSLVQHALLQPATAGPRAAQASARADTQVTMAQPVREFLRRHVPAADQAAYRAAVMRWLLAWAQALPRATPMAALLPQWPTVLDRLGAVDSAPCDVLDLLLALRPWLESGGLSTTPQDAVARALDALAPSDAARASAGHELMAYLRFEAGFAQAARRHADRALGLAGADPSLRARALVRLAWITLASGHGVDAGHDSAPGLQASLEEALRLARHSADLEAEARALHQLSAVASRLRNDWLAAEPLLAQSQALWLQLGDRRKAYARLRNRAQVWIRLQRLDDARRCLEHCVHAAADDGDVIGRVDSLLSLSTVLTAQRDWRAALSTACAGVDVSWRHWHRHGLAFQLWTPPLALAHLRRPDEALLLMAFAAAFWTSTFGPLAAEDRHTVRRVQALARRQVGAVGAELLWVEGASMNVAQAVGLLQTTAHALGATAPGPGPAL